MYVITCPVKRGMQLSIHSQTSMVALLKLGNGRVISYDIHNGCNCQSMLGKLIYVNEMNPDNPVNTSKRAAYYVVLK